MGLLLLEEKHMTKISVALATVLVLASASSNVAFAAIPNTQAAVTQGQAINECRAEGFQGKHGHIAREACVARLTNGQSTAY
jgi:hypothetical protein